MKCPRCEGRNVEIREGFVEPESMDADLYCNDCEEVVAFRRIKDEEWIETD